jgi:glutathione S-transferase
MIVPAFYRYLQAQDIEAQIESGKEFLNGVETLIKLFERAENESEDGNCGLWNEGGAPSLADILVGPCVF